MKSWIIKNQNEEMENNVTEEEDQQEEQQILMLPNLTPEAYIRSFAIYGEINEEQGREATQALKLLHDKICAERSIQEDPEQVCEPIEFLRLVIYCMKNVFQYILHL